MKIVKTLKIEDPKFNLGIQNTEKALSIIRELVTLKTKNTIHLDLVLIQKLYSKNKLDSSYQIGRGGNHIWIADKEGVRQAIIFYREVSEPVTFKVIPV